MDLKQYFSDKAAKCAELEKRHPDGVVHVTSVFYRERNSTPGAIASATCYNAARVITDGTHRESTPEEIEDFYEHQREELRRNIRSEQLKKQQYVVVTGGGDQGNALVIPAEKTRGRVPQADRHSDAE